LALRAERPAAGEAEFGSDPATWGDWIIAIERPNARYGGRYALRLGEARALLGQPAGPSCRSNSA
jgi:hypothetical protein